MNWFTRKRHNHTNGNNAGRTSPYVGQEIKEEVGYSYDRSLRSSCFKFNVYKAQGGTIIEIYPPDPSDGVNVPVRNMRPKLYIIKDEDNFAEELEKIITMESLRS